LTGDAETQAPIVTSFDQGLAIETLVLTYLLTYLLDLKRCYDLG